MTKWPFHTNWYYRGKLSYSYKRHLFKYKWSNYREIIRVGKMRDFMIYPNYAILMKRVNSRKPKK